MTNRPCRYQELEATPTISFGEEDCEGVVYPHNDAQVMTLVVANYTTRLILIDNGSSTDILFWDAFTKMGISPDRLRSSPSPLKGFSRETVQPAGAITLLVTEGKALT